MHASVTVERGQPRFIVRMWKVDPRTLRATTRIGTTSVSVPVSLRSCTPGDLAPTGTLTPLKGENAAIAKVTSQASTDCAIRSWPSMTYLDHDGDPVRPVQGGTDINGRSLDHREGAENRFHEFPPARLTPGGTGYLIVDLRTRTALEQDDKAAQAAAAQAAATPQPDPSFPDIKTPLCHPVTITAIRLGIAGSTSTVPVPISPVHAACASDSYSFAVNPVVTDNPAKQ